MFTHILTAPCLGFGTLLGVSICEVKDVIFLGTVSEPAAFPAITGNFASSFAAQAAVK